MNDWKLENILPALVDHTAAFISDATKKTEPFLLYLPLAAPHTPLAVTPEWQVKSHLNVYADFVMETDAGIGRVLDALEKSGSADHTLVFFSSDNGCAPYMGAKDLEIMGHYPSGPLRGYKSDVYEGGHRISFVVRWPGVVKPGSTCGQLVLQADYMATIADILDMKLPDTAGEDSFSLLPLLKREDQPVREPTIAWWPGKIAPGSVCDAVAGNIDFLPAFVALGGGNVPSDKKIDGKDILPLLLGQTKESPHKARYYYLGY